MKFCSASTIVISIILHNSCITYGYAVNKQHGDCIPGLEDLCALCEPYKTQTGKAVAYPGKDGDVLQGCHHFVECFWTSESISAPYLRRCGVLGDGIYMPTSKDDKHCVEADTLTVSEHPCGTKGSGGTGYNRNKTRWKRDEEDYLDIREIGGRKCSGDKEAYAICHLCPDYVSGRPNVLLPYPGLNNDPLDGCHKYIDCRWYDQPYDYLLPLILLCVEHGQFNIGMRNGIWMPGERRCVKEDSLTSKQHICGTKDKQTTTTTPSHFSSADIISLSSDPQPLFSDKIQLLSDPQPLLPDPEPLLSDPKPLSDTELQTTPPPESEKSSSDPDLETKSPPDLETASSETELVTTTSLPDLPGSETVALDEELETTTPPPDSKTVSEPELETTPPTDSDPERETTSPSDPKTVSSDEELETTTPTTDSDPELESTSPPDSKTVSSDEELETTTPPTGAEKPSLMMFLTSDPESETTTTTQAPDSEIGPSESETTTPPTDSDPELSPPDSKTVSSDEELETTTPPTDSEKPSLMMMFLTSDPESETTTTTQTPDSEVGSSESETTTPPKDFDPELETTSPTDSAETVSSEPELETITSPPDSETISSDEEPEPEIARVLLQREKTTVPPEPEITKATTSSESHSNNIALG